MLVLGTLRSGSTLLGRMLGGERGACCVGEVRNSWRAFVRNELCSCGSRTASCELWAAVGEELGYLRGGHPTGEVRTLHSIAESTLKLPHLVPWRADLAGHEQRLSRELRRIYVAVASQVGADIIVDTSKTPNMLRIAAASELRVLPVHLVRDPRGVAASESTPKIDPSGDVTASPPQRTALASGVHWAATNWLVERELRLGHRTGLFVRYEDMLDAPAATLTRVQTAIGGPLLVESPAPAKPQGLPSLRPTDSHQLGGNPDRFHHEALALRPDARWRSKLGFTQRVALQGMLFPLMKRYGYR